MDRSLDEAISDRQRDDSRGGRGRRQNTAPRDGIRKNQRGETSGFDREWVHDRFNEVNRDRDAGRKRHGAKIRVDNLHYDLGEDDLHELFTRIGPIESLELLYDRQDRSRGIALVTYVHNRDAETAIREFNNANANGQPIKVEFVDGPPAATSRRNPFDSAERPGRSLFDRVERRRSASPGNEDYGSRTRRGRRTDARNPDEMNPTSERIDRYVPGQSGMRRSPVRRNRDGNRSAGAGSSGPGQRRERDRTGRPRKDDDGHVMVQGRPRKTQEELDAEMADYWVGGDAGPNAAANGTAPHDDTDMIE